MRLGIRSHAKGTFHNYVEKGKELETAKMFRVAADKFIVNITFGWEHAVAITDENDAGKLVSHRFPQYSFNNGMVPKFFRYLILDENFKHHLELSSPGGAGRNRVLKLNEMLEYKMNFPSEEEQNKIASYFDSLDHLITLHQRKCDELQKLKKFMLQNMFTNIGNGKSHLFYYMDFIKKDKYPTGHRHEIRYKKRSFLRRMLQHIKRCCEKMSKINVSIQKKLL